MKQSAYAQALQSASRTCRNWRRQHGEAAAWVRQWRRANHAIEASMRLIGATLRTVERSERCARRHPLRTARDLQHAAARLRDIDVRLERAYEELAATRPSVLAPDETVLVPELMIHASHRLLKAALWLQDTSEGVDSLQKDVLLGLETGVLVPEQPAKRRQRIIMAPRPAPIRAFLLLRQPRAVDRIAAILRRRRRTPRPASVRVPRRSLLGRAPPLF